MDFLTTDQPEGIPPEEVPELPFALFYAQAVALLEHPAYRLVCYEGVRHHGDITVWCALAHRQTKRHYLARFTLLDEPGILLASLQTYSEEAAALEQQLNQRFGITFAHWSAPQEQVVAAFKEMLQQPKSSSV